ncbi:MAG: MFS transporter [Coriobacteriales bacterium]|jgi:FSR family fosmidomycin resistance protein-like MFS transporter|nr:MFS transporter [Coriobacteriales bacterium]
MLSKKHSYLLTLAHFCTDLNQGAIPAMIPFLLLVNPQYSIAQTTLLVLANGVVSSVVQPIFGYIGDKVEKPWLMALGVFMSGLGVSMFAFFSNFVVLFFSCMFCGFGVALFHPEGGRLANVVAGASKGEGMSNFGVGGTLGFFGGAILVTVFFGALGFGLHGAIVFLVLAAIAAILLLSQTKNFRRLTEIDARRKVAKGLDKAQDHWPEFWKVSLVNTFRCIIFNAMQVFIPLIWVRIFLVGNPNAETISTLMLAIASLVGAVGTFFGGRIADRVGFKKDIVICSALLICGIGLFLIVANLYLDTNLKTLLVVLAGIIISVSLLFLQTAYSPVIALSQKQLPNHVGMASGIALGVSVSLGSVCSPILGAVGDSFGLLAVFGIIFALTICIFLMSLTLRSDRVKSKQKKS